MGSELLGCLRTSLGRRFVAFCVLPCAFLTWPCREPRSRIRSKAASQSQATQQRSRREASFAGALCSAPDLILQDWDV